MFATMDRLITNFKKLSTKFLSVLVLDSQQMIKIIYIGGKKYKIASQSIK